jgi:hypothetical protein
MTGSCTLAAWVADRVEHFGWPSSARKSSVRPILKPLANKHGADAVLMTGDISDTRLYELMLVGVERPTHAH